MLFIGDSRPAVLPSGKVCMYQADGSKLSVTLNI